MHCSVINTKIIARAKCFSTASVTNIYFVHRKSVCQCNDGTPMSGANCKSDRGFECESCDAGFKLRQDKTACDGMFSMGGVMVTGTLDACSCFGPGVDLQRFGTFIPCSATHVFVYALWCVGCSKNP